jgi:hypothetical protein
MDRLGIRLAIRGDRLVVDAPAGVMTPELRDALAIHKPALLRLLAGEDDQTVRPAVAEPLTGACDTAPLFRCRTAPDAASGSLEPPPAPRIAEPEVVAAIDRAFSGSAPATRSDRGPRDRRRGDRWLPWHFDGGTL